MHAACVACKQVDALSINRVVEAVIVLRGITVAPKQHVLLVGDRAKAACVVKGASVIAEAGARAIDRPHVVTVVDIQHHRVAVGTRRRLAQDDSARAAGQQGRRRKARHAKRGAACRRRRPQAKRLFDKSP